MNERLKKLRKALDLTQQEFAEIIGIKRNTIATYESGRNDPIDAVLSLICKTSWNGKYVNEEWLRNGNGEMFLQLSMDEQITTFIEGIQTVSEDSFKKRFVSAISELEESDWEILEKIILKISKREEVKL